ncbi:SH3 domain-containing protein [Hahella sp. CR1]|uniref:SH3 domain-containing protein n=1 Tax=Hahella sp. CR1 TaxID=2992807 RepID=UPI00244202EE|nr:SH3 domain-containing protein [Hahella sp. CR1]MDG9667970.1 SH3 domain-containing protein [Hahella sp. CR1]
MLAVRIFPVLLVILCCFSLKSFAEDEYQTVKVAEPYLEFRTGPGRGYPVFFVVEQDEQIEILKRKTEWFKVRNAKGQEGWASRAQMEMTLDGSGEQVAFKEPRFDDFSSRSWEGGVATGDFGGAAVNSMYVGYLFTPNLSTELWASQVLGDFSQIMIADLNIVHQPFPHWRISPFFTLGTGAAFIKPKATLVNEDNRVEEALHYGLGVRWYMTNRYFIRMEYKDYVVFTDRDENEEAEEWKIGLSVFF